MKDINDVQHSIPIIIKEMHNKFYFLTKEDKDTYIKDENKYCEIQNQSYMSAFDILERRCLKLQLEEKRLAFAKHCGFQQVGRTKNWNRVINKDAILA